MSREDIIRQIVERDIQNQLLSSDNVLRDAPELHAVATEHFGTWETALQYSGISEYRVAVEADFSADQVLRRLQTMCTSGYNLSMHRNSRRDRRFYLAARLHFGSWKEAMLAAGINLKNVRMSSKPRRLDREKIIEQLRMRQAAGLSIERKTVFLENRTLAIAATSVFHSWPRALVAAGLMAKENLRDNGGRKWDKQRVIAAINKRRREGRDCDRPTVRRDSPRLVDAAQRYFGTWKSALEAAGMNDT